MGAWGPGLYQDDVALDTKETYKNMLGKNNDKKIASEATISSIDFYFTDTEDRIPAILALADTQWKYGKLLPEIKKEALRIIETDEALIPWQENQSQLKKRKEVLQRLKEKLESPQPKEKQIKVKKPFVCEWKCGDVYAYQLESSLSKIRLMYKKYLLLIKVGECVIENDVYPIVYAKITKKRKLPKSLEEIKKLKFRLIDISYEQKKEYHITIIANSKRAIPKKLIYLGNFPLDELLSEQIEIDNSYNMMLWKDLEHEILTSIPIIIKIFSRFDW